MKVTLTTICGTDVHIWREEYPVEHGRIVGHEPVGVIHELGEAVAGYEVGDRVLVGAITPCGSCFYCQSHSEAQCSGYEDEWEMIGGWRLGNSIDGVQADYFRVPYAQANLAKIPDDLSDEQCVLLADIASTGISAAETRRRADRPDRRRLRPGPDRPLRDGRRAADGRLADHRRRRDREAAGALPERWAPTR